MGEGTINATPVSTIHPHLSLSHLRGLCSLFQNRDRRQLCSASLTSLDGVSASSAVIGADGSATPASIIKSNQMKSSENRTRRNAARTNQRCWSAASHLWHVPDVLTFIISPVSLMLLCPKLMNTGSVLTEREAAVQLSHRVTQNLLHTFSCENQDRVSLNFLNLISFFFALMRHLHDKWLDAKLHCWVSAAVFVRHNLLHKHSNNQHSFTHRITHMRHVHAHTSRDTTLAFQKRVEVFLRRLFWDIINKRRTFEECPSGLFSNLGRLRREHTLDG